MLFSNAEIVKHSNHTQERFKALSGVPSVKAVQPAQTPNESTQDETKNALLRFARFVNEDGEGTRKHKEQPRSEVRKNVSKAMRPFLKFEDKRGQVLDIYV